MAAWATPPGLEWDPSISEVFDIMAILGFWDNTIGPYFSPLNFHTAGSKTLLFLVWVGFVVWARILYIGFIGPQSPKPAKMVALSSKTSCDKRT